MLLEAIQKRYTDYEGLKEAFKKTVMSAFLPGWVWLAVMKNQDGSVGDIVIQHTNNQDNTLMVQGAASCGAIPIIALNIWEHAYWECHNGDKESYLEAFWAVIDWEKVSVNFESLNVNGKVAPLLQ